MGPPTTTVDVNGDTETRAHRHYHDNASDVSSEASESPNPHALEFELPTWLDRLKDRAGEKVPQPIKRVWSAVVVWVKGPKPPRTWKITPLLPRIQRFPLDLKDRYLPKRIHRFWALIFFYFCFLLIFVTVLHKSAFTSQIEGFGTPQSLTCGATMWSDKNGCGIDGDDCRPFVNSSLPFRCPGNCLKEQVLNPHAVGAYEANYQPLVIGGPPDGQTSVGSAFYRGDSFICGSAVHAGYITNQQGGCGVLQVVGTKQNFPSVNKNAINSIAFDSNFPLSFQFVEDAVGNCKDLRWPLLGVSVTFSAILSLFTTSPIIFFASLFAGLFWHVALVSDPPTETDYYSLVSITMGRFLPASFVMFVYYKYVIYRTLKGLRAQIEKTILWVGACWVGCLNNQTFDKIPIQRLTPHDLQQQPGAIPALVIIVLVIVAIAIGQAWAIRVEGKMPFFLALYAGMGFCLLMMVAIPNMNLRIHHYILALLLLPGTAMQNRPSLLYQGLLVGLFINGIARWDFSSIIQTPGELLADGQLGSALPVINTPTITPSNITFTWQPIADDFDGISVLVNDVERFRGFEVTGPFNFTWNRDVQGLPEYFRFGFLEGSTPGDYTKAGIWEANGTWTTMESGPSR